VEARHHDAPAALSLFSWNLLDHCPTFCTIPTRSTELSRVVGRSNYQKCVWYCWKFVSNWQPLLFPCNFQITAMAAQCLSLNDAHWIIIFNHRWKVDVEVCSKPSMRGGGWGLGGTCESCCGMDTPKKWHGCCWILLRMMSWSFNISIMKQQVC
jgi:hypothetical protein